MKLQVTKKLVESGIDGAIERQVWADLGSGDGTFTYALSTVLPDESVIHAVDVDGDQLDRVRTRPHVSLVKHQSDFITCEFTSEPLDGILMANALHFVKHQRALLENLKNKLNPHGRVLVIEYEMNASNQWVPYPIRFDSLKHVASAVGFHTIEKLHSVPSIYGNRTIYSAVLITD
jgi:trans-aconitate methyltransferase